MDPEVIGRDAELAVVNRALAAAPLGPVGLVVSGEVGIGKTTLWKAAVHAARARSYPVLVARPAETEGGLSFSGLADILSHIAEPVLPALSPLQRRALEMALLKAPGDDADPPDQRTIGMATLSTLRALATMGPIVVAVDDVQWLDQASARVLQFAARRLDPAPVMMLASTRTGCGPADPLGLAGAMAHDRLFRLDVGPLTVAALHHLVASRLGLRLSHSVVVRLHRASAGNPFFALELARAFEGGQAGLRPGQALPVREDLRALVRDRLDGLSAEAADAVVVIASAHQPDMDLVETVLGPAGGAGVAQATAAGLVETDGERLRLTHPLLGSTAYVEALPARRRRLHAALARAVTEPVERARHLALAVRGPDAGVAEALEVAAGAAAGRGAPDGAAELAEQASRLTPPAYRDDRRRREVAAAGYHARSGDWGRARLLLEGVVAGSPRGRLRAHALALLGQVRYSDNSVTEAIPLLLQAVDEAEGDAELLARVELDLAVTMLQSGSLLEGQPHAQAALAHAERLGRPGPLGQALAVAAMVQFLTGRGLNRAALDRALALEDRRVVGLPWMRPRFVAACVWMWAGLLDEARKAFADVHRELVDEGEEAFIPMLSLHATQAECWAGNLAGARAYAATSGEAALLCGGDVAHACALTAQAHLHAHLGEADETRRKAGEAVVTFVRCGFRIHTVWPLWALGTLELSVGDAAAVHRLLGPLTDVVAASGLSEAASAPFVPDEIEALVALGDLERARKLLGWLDDHGRAVDRPWAQATAGRCRALVLAAEGDLEQAAQAVCGALVHHERVAMPIERARTLLVKGQLHRRRKEKRAAKDALSEALAVFEEMGTARWAERARQELGRVGLRPPAPLDLTVTEAKVAKLASDGLTTKQIADRAFVSTKTVEGVLGRIYRKLGVHSRVELAAVLVKRQEG